MKIDITYCAAWNFKPLASGLEEELRQKFGAGIQVELIAGSGGIFEVVADGRPVFSKKKQGRFPDPGEIVNLLGG